MQDLEKLKYPIGEYSPPKTITETQLKEWIELRKTFGLNEFRPSDERDRTAADTVEQRDQLRHRGHRDTPRDNPADRAADRAWNPPQAGHHHRHEQRQAGGMGQP